MLNRILALEQVNLRYGSGTTAVDALSNVSISFSPGTLTLIMGPSGSGKTSLLSLLGCLLRPASGSVFISGKEVSAASEEERTDLRRESIGFIFQAFRLFRSLTALDNVLLTSEIAARGASDDGEIAADLLRRLGLGDKLNLKPDALSGGEKQRVAIARALMKNPAIILADEPTASLDTMNGQRICEILHDVAKTQKCIVVIVSHDHRVRDYADRRVTLLDGRLSGSQACV